MTVIPAVASLPVAPAAAPQKYIDMLLRRLWITKGIRFESNRRLVKQHEATHLAISTLSVYVIWSALLELLVKTIDPAAAHTKAVEYLFPLATIAAPVFILVLEKHTAGKHYLVKAERMERSALKIQALHSELEFHVAHGTATPDQVERARSEYELIMRDFTQNHDNIDYLYFMALHPERFGDESGFSLFKRRVRGRIAHYVDVWGVPAALIVVPGALIIYAAISMVRGA